MSKLSLFDEDRTLSAHKRDRGIRWIAWKWRRCGPKSVSRRNSDRSGTRRLRCSSVGASATCGTCSIAMKKEIPILVFFVWNTELEHLILINVLSSRRPNLQGDALLVDGILVFSQAIGPSCLLFVGDPVWMGPLETDRLLIIFMWGYERIGQCVRGGSVVCFPQILGRPVSLEDKEEDGWRKKSLFCMRQDFRSVSSLSREFGSRIDCRRWSNGWRRDGRTGGRRGCWSLEIAFWRLAVGEVAD
nr:uncharacterized protein LOC109191297 [Ipomoea batatas]GMD45396.1 uncharacterized protein LOC109191297 [Ipomoea batatas]